MARQVKYCIRTCNTCEYNVFKGDAIAKCDVAPNGIPAQYGLQCPWYQPCPGETHELRLPVIELPEGADLSNVIRLFK